MNEWFAEGKKNWRKNLDTRAKEIARQQYFVDREQQKFQDYLTRELNIHTDEMNNGIEWFHENM